MWCQVSARCCCWQEGLPCRGNAVWWYMREEQGTEEMPEEPSLEKARGWVGILARLLKAPAKGNKVGGEQQCVTFQLKG